MFDSTKSGRIEKEKVRTILNTLGHTFDDHELEVLLKQEDEEGSYIYNNFQDKIPKSDGYSLEIAILRWILREFYDNCLELEALVEQISRQ